MIQKIKKERFFAFFERLDVRLIHDKTKTRPLSRHWLFGAIPSAVHIKIRNTYTCICVHIQNTGLDKLTRLHLSTFDCPLKLLSLSLEEERGGSTIVAGKICSANDFNHVSHMMIFSKTPYQGRDEPSSDTLRDYFSFSEMDYELFTLQLNRIQGKLCIVTHDRYCNPAHLRCIIFLWLSLCRSVLLELLLWICNRKSIILSVVLKNIEKTNEKLDIGRKKEY